MNSLLQDYQAASVPQLSTHEYQAEYRYRRRHRRRRRRRHRRRRCRRCRRRRLSHM